MPRAAAKAAQHPDKEPARVAAVWAQAAVAHQVRIGTSNRAQPLHRASKVLVHPDNQAAPDPARLVQLPAAADQKVAVTKPVALPKCRV